MPSLLGTEALSPGSDLVASVKGESCVWFRGRRRKGD